LDQMDAAVARLRDAGAEITDIMLPAGWDAVWPVFTLVMGGEQSPYHGRHTGDLITKGADIAPVLADLIPATYYLQAQRVRRWLSDSVLPLFDQVDFLLTPAAVEEPPLGHGGGDNRMNSPWS